jgi:hypothetical protein
MRVHHNSGTDIAERLLDPREQFLGHIWERIEDPAMVGCRIHLATRMSSSLTAASTSPRTAATCRPTAPVSTASSMRAAADPRGAVARSCVVPEVRPYCQRAGCR